MLKEREWRDSEDVELVRANQRPDRQGRKVYLKALAESGLIVRTDPDHPNSPRQKYRLTAAGQKRIERVAPL